jgi:8-oxo-dGTP pyrophosphatase MutT (NUDIX family)
MPDAVTPLPAATLVLVRDRPSGGIETLLLQRHAGSKFAPGDYVFAGGKVAPEDRPNDVEEFCCGLTAAQAAACLGAVPITDALAYWVGAIREAFEEVGILLAYTPDDELIQFSGDNRERFASYRAACQTSDEAFFTMLRAERLTLATDRLVYFAHWITPEQSPIRFDTRFFATVAPSGQEAMEDGREIVDVRWLTPADALETQRRREISLRLPTIKNLEILGAGASGGNADAAALVASLRGREVVTMCPRLLTLDGKTVAVLPGDPRYFLRLPSG